ncbi:MAG: HNH endonuclease [Hyphomicrobiaceae bacterium]
MTRSNMPSPKAIRAFWAPRLAQLGKVGDVIDLLEDDWNGFPRCFRCGNPHILQRAHIIALQAGGSNHANNLHLLCKPCHVESEHMPYDQYWAWFAAVPFDPPKHILDRAAQRLGHPDHASLRGELAKVPEDRRGEVHRLISRTFGLDDPKPRMYIGIKTDAAKPWTWAEYSKHDRRKG